MIIAQSTVQCFYTINEIKIATDNPGEYREPNEGDFILVYSTGTY